MARVAEPKIIDFNEGWQTEIQAKAIARLETLLNEGIEKNKRQTGLFPPKEFMHTYTVCYNMCTQRSPHNWSEQLYQKHGETIKQYLTDTVVPALVSKHNEYLLKELVERWRNHKIMNEWMRKFFMYLDRYYVKHHSLPTLSEAGLKYFKDLVYERVKSDVVKAMLLVINQERAGTIIDRDLLRNCVELFEAMGMNTLDTYNADFEESLMNDTRNYYMVQSQVWIDSDSTPDYLVKAEAALNQEQARVKTYLHPTTDPKLQRVVEEELLQKRQTALLDKEGSGCRVLLANDKSEDLSRMYRLFGRLPEGLVPVATIVKEFITKAGHHIVNDREIKESDRHTEKDSSPDAAFVKELLDLHDKYMAVVNNQFAGHSLLQKALKEAFEAFINRDMGNMKIAELMASYCDRILKTGGDKLTDEEVETSLTKLVQLFGYLTDKDLFAEIYRNQQSKRLLSQRSASDEWERSLIGKLKQACGSQYTSKMEGMMTDLAIGVEKQGQFATYLQEKRAANVEAVQGLGGIEFNVQVLTTGYWPTLRNVENLKLTPEMSRCQEFFEHYYKNLNDHRRLAWQYGQGTVTIKAKFKKPYDITVTTLQACVLMLFNYHEGFMNFKEIMEKSGGAEDMIKKVMHSLVCNNKTKLLVKDNSSNFIKPTDNFRINENFASLMRKIRVPMAMLDESHNPKRVDEDRSIAIEAAIVRAMKARKTLAHTDLIGEVLKQLEFFQPDTKLIKKKIEALIEREYMERDMTASSSGAVYKYMA